MAQRTTSVPCMLGWIEQVKRYEPGVVGATMVVVPFAGTVTSKLPLSAVTVWATPSVFDTVTVAPAGAEAALKANPLMRIVGEAAGFGFLAYGPDGAAAAMLAGAGAVADGW
jgi:hypothetical protein